MTRALRAGLLLGIGLAIVAYVVVVSRPRPLGDGPAELPAGSPRQTAPAVARREVGYVGTESCRACHRELTETYLEHPMARSIRSAATDLAEHPEVCTVGEVTAGRRDLTAGCKNGEMVHHERMSDAQGAPIYDLAVPQEFVIGSGQRARAYLHRRGEAVLMSPLNWFQGTQAWNLSPGYAVDDPRRFDRRVKAECLNCHAGRVQELEIDSDRFSSEPFAEMAIGCERCHGPGAEHIAHRRLADEERQGSDPILNPAVWDHERQEALCYQCHLTTTARIPRRGQSHLDFRPGQRLSDIWAILDVQWPAGDAHRSHSVKHVQQMRSSRCFIASDGQLGCTSCHDPHRAVAPEEQAEYYRARCATCHAEAACGATAASRAAAADDCIHCHMPRLAASNMVHVVQTDHRIVRDRDAAGAASDNANEGVLAFFADMEAELPADEQSRAWALGEFVHCTAAGQPLPDDLRPRLEQLLEQFPDDGRVLETLGAVAVRQGDEAAARRYYEHAAQIPAGRDPALRGLLRLTYAAGDWRMCVDFADQLLAVDPGDSGVLALRGDARLQLGQVDAALDDVRQAIRLNPGSVDLRIWLARQCERLGLFEELQEQSRMIDRLQAVPAGAPETN